MSDETAAASPDAASPDDALLDRLLTEFIAAIGDGRTVDLAAVQPARPDLSVRIRETWALALDIAPRRPAATPEFAGYEILRELGRGGMGQVYLARHRRLGRVVALKVLPRRLAVGRARERFEREARAVARLQHPLVVPVYDLGEADGQPYFTMAYVEGATLGSAIRAARGRPLSSLRGDDFAAAAGAEGSVARWAGPWWRAAAQTAADVADALSYAHAEGVIHRDVKPSNVMLRRDGFALLFDFGLAAVDDEASLTLTEGFVGTPHYASPEQAAGTTDALDARTDVFSLGAALYEALTLSLPFPGPTTHEVLRRIQTWEPEPPSKLDPSIPRDLETVVLAALEKDPAKRYAGAAEFASDLRAVLAGKRVRAKRAGFLERGLRSVRRGRALTELLVEQQTRNAELRSAVLRAERNEAEARAARARAEAERDKAAAVTSLLVDTLGSADPAAGGRDVRVADVLRQAAERARTSFARHPEIRASVLGVVVRALSGLGDVKTATEIAEEALAAARRDLPPESREVVALLTAAATSAAVFGDTGRGLALAREAAEAARRSRGAGDPETLEAIANLGGILMVAGFAAESEDVLRPGRDLAVRTLGARHEATLHLENNLALTLAFRGSAAEADRLMFGVWEARRDLLGERHPDSVASLALAAQLRKEAGRAIEAVPLFERAVAICADVFGARHPTTIMSLHNLAGSALDAGHVAAARRTQEDALRAADGVYGPETNPTAALHVQHGRICAALGDHATAVSSAVRAADVFRLLGDEAAALRADEVAAASRRPLSAG